MSLLQVEPIQRLRLDAADRDTPYGCRDSLIQAANALEDAKAEIERLADELNAMKEWKDSMRDEMEALKAPAAKDAADAGRYRKLPSINWYVGPEYETYNDTVCSGEYRNYAVNRTEMDTAIDAAMKESQQ